jgi:hypothetical protein
MAASLSNISLNDILSDASFICEMPLDTIYADAFQNVSTLTCIEIHNASYINDNTFNGCVNLQRLIIPGIDYNNNIFGSTIQDLSISYLEIKEGTSDINTTLSGLGSNNNIYLNLKLPSTLSILHSNALSGVNCESLNF